MNPIAINLWLVGASAGYAIGDLRGCAIGIAITATVTFLINMLPGR